MMLRRILLTVLVSLSMSLTVMISLPVTTHALVSPSCRTSFMGLPTWYKYLDVGPQGADRCAITGPRQYIVDSRGNTVSNLDVPTIAGRVALAVVEIMLRVAVIAAMAYVLYGGFRYITSQGEPDATKSARHTIQNALVGMIIALLASAIVAFIAKELTS